MSWGVQYSMPTVVLLLVLEYQFALVRTGLLLHASLRVDLCVFTSRSCNIHLYMLTFRTLILRYDVTVLFFVDRT